MGLANLFMTSSSSTNHGDLYSRPSSVASTPFGSDYSNSTTIEDKSPDLTNLRPRARTDASTLLGSSNSTSTITLESSQDHTDAPNSPKNLKKLTAAIRANTNNNVARVNRPLSTRGLDNEGLVTTTTAGSNHDHHHNSSPPMNSGKKR